MDSICEKRCIEERRKSMSRSEKEATMQYAIAVHLGEKNIVIPKLALREHHAE